MEAAEIPVLESPEIHRRRRTLALSALVVVAFLCAVFGMVGGAGYAGFSRGIAERPTRTAGGIDQDPSYLIGQFQKCVDGVNAANGARAQAYCEEVLRLQPGNRGAQELLTTAVALQVIPTVAVYPTAVRVKSADSAAVFAQFQTAVQNKDWDAAINFGSALRALDRRFEKDAVETGLFGALTTRGTSAINNGNLEAGLFDLEVAAAIRKLDDRTEGTRQIVSLYQDAQYFYGADWDTAIAKYRQVYAFSPGFRDTARKLFDSYLRSGEEHDARRDYCTSERRYAGALQLFASPDVDAKRAQAQIYCLNPPILPPILIVTPGPGTVAPQGTPYSGTLPLGYPTPTARP